MPTRLLISIGVIVALALAARWHMRRRAFFRIEIVDGEPRLRHGQPPEGLLRDVRAICQLWSIGSGTVTGEPGAGRRMKIRASGEAAPHEQAFRNAAGHPIEP